jgi:hypothetical protein
VTIPRYAQITVGGVPRPVDLLANYVPPGPGVATFTEQPGYLANPNIGYQGWTHATAQIAETLEYRRGNHPQQGGFDWATLNPSNGGYNWSPIDTVLAECAARGQQLSFRVMTMLGDDFGGHLVPAWAVTAGATIRANGEPDYRTRAYQQYFGIFVDALAARYDGDDRIAFIDISGYGLYNEWQANTFTDQSGADFEGNGTSVDARTRRHLVHMFVGGSGTTGVIETNGSEGTMAYNHPGFQQTQLIQPYGGLWSTIRYVLANYSHVGWRNDALMGPDAQLADFQAIGYGITTRWQTAPAVFEPISGAQTSAYPEAVAAMAGTGASLLHDNSLPLTGLADLVAPLGYRYFCSQVETVSSVAAGADFLVHTTWTNTGTARAYLRMGQDFAICLALADTAGAVVAQWVTGWNVSTWLPGVQQDAWDEIPAPATPGSYTLLIGIREQNTGQRILLPLPDGRSDRWYPALPIAVQ